MVNYSLLHNISVLYYWWTVTLEQEYSKDIHEHKLWENLIGYWTAIVNNDEFWERWAKHKPWIKNRKDLDLSKIRNNLMSHLETKILTSAETDKHQDGGVAAHRSNLKKLHIEKRFVTYYKELKNVLSDDVAAIPDMYSETLIRDLDMQGYIRELSDMALKKDPYNEKIKKIKYYLSPFRYIAVLIEEDNYEHAIKELDALPSNSKNDDIVCELMAISKLKLGASYLQNDNIVNHALRAEKLWNECHIMNNEMARSIIGSAAVDAMKKFKAEDKIEVAICAGEVGLKFTPENSDVKILLSVLLNDRGVKRWNSGLTDFSMNSGMHDIEKALEYNSNNVRAKRNLSIMYSLTGWKYKGQKDPKISAKEMFDKALELDKDNEEAKKGLSVIYNGVGIVFANAEKKQEASNYFLWALYYNPTDKTILNNLKKVNFAKYQEHVSLLKKRGISLGEDE